jgi:hypothetical protein
MIKVDVEPLVDIFMYFVISVAEFLWGYPLLLRPGLRGGSIFIGTANIKSFVTVK